MRMDRHRLPHFLCNINHAGNEEGATPHKTSQLLMGQEQVTRLKTLQTI